MGVTVATIRAAANTSTGTQDFTTTDLGGLTPKAVLLIATRATADGTAADGAGWYIGASDGTNEWAGSYEDEHAQATTDGYANQDATANRILTIYDGTADGVVAATADFDSFITNGVRINWTDAPPAAYLVTAIFFAGSDLTVKVGNSDLGNTANAAIDITTVGFEADDIICVPLVPDAGITSGYMGFGFAHNDRAGGVTQRCAALVTRGFSTSQLGAQVRSDACILKLINSTQATDWYGTAESFDSSGFTIQLGNSRTPVNNDLGWIALRYGASPVILSKVYTYPTPTSTGSNTDAGAGFEPQAVMYIPTFCAVAGTSETDADAGTIGLSIIDVTKAYCNSVQSEDAQADSDTQSMSDDKAINLPTDAGATGIEAAFTSFGATGVTLNFTAVAGAAKLFPAIAWGINAGGGDLTVELNTLTLAGSIQDLAAVPGAASVALDTLSLVGAVQALTLTTLTNILLDTLNLTLAAQNLTVTPGGASLTLDTLNLTSTVQDLTVTPGAISLLLDTLTLTGSVEDLTVATLTSILLDTLTLLGSVQDLTPVPGAVSLALDTLSLAGSVEDLSVITGAVSLTLNTLTLTGGVQSLTITAGAVSITLDTLNLTGSVEDLAVALGALAIVLDTLTLAGSVQTLTVSPGAVAILLDTINLAGSVEDLTVALGALAILLDTLNLSASVQGLTVVPGAVAALLNTLILAGSIQDLAIIPGGVTTLLDTLSLAGSVEDLGLTADTLILLDTLNLGASVEDLALLPGGVAVSLDTINLASSVLDLTVSLLAGILAVGRVRVEFTAKRPGATFSGKRPSVEFTEE